jgi:alpha-ketoglutarate-dependent taurine dioxygenase
MVATSASARRGDAAAKTIGLLLNTVLLRMRTDCASFRDLVVHSRNILLDAHDRAEVSAEELLSAIGVVGADAEALLTRLVVGYRIDRGGRLELPGAVVESIRAACRSVKADLEIQFVADREGLGGFIDFDRAVYDPSAIAAISDALERIARRAAPDASVGLAELAKLAISSQRSSSGPLISRRPPAIVRLSNEEIVEILKPLAPGEPALVTPKIDGLDLDQWLAGAFERVDGLVKTHGAVRLRGFGKMTADMLQQILHACQQELLPDEEQTSPRRHLGKAIYTSTEYSRDHAIPLHNENSYAARWPMKLWFACVTPAERGGETPLADSALVHDRIDPAVRAEFERKKIAYIRNFDDHLSLPWQQVFGTEQRSEVEAYCRLNRITAQWLDKGRLRTTQTRNAVIAHPVTGARLWFNQAHLFHASALGPELGASLARVFAEEDLPRHARFGDGTAIDANALEHIRDVYVSSMIKEPWQAGDVVYLDNMRIAHGRQPFTGERSIIVAMTGQRQLQSGDE